MKDIERLQWLNVLCDSRKADKKIKEVLDNLDEANKHLDGETNKLTDLFISKTKSLIQRDKICEIKQLLCAMEDVADIYEQFKFCNEEDEIRKAIVDRVFRRYDY